MAALILLVLFVLMWIVLIVPRQREVRRHRRLVATLGVGDEVMTSSGIYGTINAVTDDEVRLEVAPGLELRVARRAVAAKVPEPAEQAEAPAIEAERAALDEGATATELETPETPPGEQDPGRSD